MSDNNYILGAGITGLTAGLCSGLAIFEANNFPGGICTSYFMSSSTCEKFIFPPDDEAFRFEYGGGHWIFGYDNDLLEFINKFALLNHHFRKSSVFFPDKIEYIPYPIQNNLRFFPLKTILKVLIEITRQGRPSPIMKGWLEQVFGSTLCNHFFFPFHELYTAGLYDRISPQDSYKTPINFSQVVKGAFGGTSPMGYNTSFVYPVTGLNTMVREMSLRCDVRYNKRVVKIDPFKKYLYFHDDEKLSYDKLISTLPLNIIMELTSLKVDTKPDPYTSVLVVNIGAFRGNQCPDDHWLYIPNSSSGFYRVGFYSNVDPSFLPKSGRMNGNMVNIYVERAFRKDAKPSDDEINQYIINVGKELQKWKFIDEICVIDTNWIEVAYTWSWPGSKWIKMSVDKLKKFDIHQIGRYGKWKFQGISDSIRDGLSANALLNIR